MYKGVELVGSFPGGVSGVNCHAASCSRHVKECTASSISSGCFSLMLSFILSTMCVRKAFQYVLDVISLGVFGLQSTWVLSVVMMGLWSEDRSQFAAICM
jgi:hypothetical protein